MPHEPRSLDELISTLKQQRDELAVRMHLASAETKKEWEKLAVRFNKLMDDYQPLKKAVGESAGKVGESLKQVAVELKSSFDRIRKSL